MDRWTKAWLGHDRDLHPTLPAETARAVDRLARSSGLNRAQVARERIRAEEVEMDESDKAAGATPSPSPRPPAIPNRVVLSLLQADARQGEKLTVRLLKVLTRTGTADPEAVRLLRRLLRRTKYAGNMTEALMEIDPDAGPWAAKLILERLRKDPPSERGQLLAALLVCGYNGKEALPLAEAALQDADSHVRCGGLALISTLYRSATHLVGRITEMLRDEFPLLRSRAVCALAEIARVDPKAAVPLVPFQRCGTVEEVFHSACAQVRAARVTPTTIRALTRVAREGDAWLRSEALFRLDDRDRLPEATLKAFEAGLRDESPRVRYLSARALLRRKRATKAAISALMWRFQGADARARRAALASLVFLDRPPEDLVKTVQDALGDPDLGVRTQAALRLFQWDRASERVAEVLLEAGRDPALRDRAEAILALAMMGSHEDEVEPLLAGLLRSEDAETRMQAALALVGMDRLVPGIAPVLRGLVNDRKPFCRAAAVLGLAQIPEEVLTMKDNALAALKDRDEHVRDAASLALQHIREAERRYGRHN